MREVGCRTEIVQVIAGQMLGPMLTKVPSYSQKDIPKIMSGEMNGMVPLMTVPSVDVRDLATALVNALHAPNLANKRFIVASKSISSYEMGLVLMKHFNGNGFNLNFSPVNSCCKACLQCLVGIDVNRQIDFDDKTAIQLIGFKPVFALEDSVV